MRHMTLIIALSCLGFACNKAPSLAGNSERSGDFQTIVEVPATEGKTDRPTESGEGLPGYLMDPSKIAIDVKANVWTVTGAAQALRNVSGENLAVDVILVTVNKSSVKQQKSGLNWTMNGSSAATMKSSADGSFVLSASLAADDLLFVKFVDSHPTTIQYLAAQPSSSTLWVEAGGAKPIDQAASDVISGQMAAAQSAAKLAALVEQVKTTGKCKNCDLRNADLSNISIPGCDLSVSNLQGAKFRSSDLSGCLLNNSNLSQVDFTQANLSNANLTESDISGAIFTSATVTGVIGKQIP